MDTPRFPPLNLPPLPPLNIPCLGAGDLLPLLATSASPAPSLDDEEPPKGLLRRAWAAWRDPNGVQLTFRSHGDYSGPVYMERGWWVNHQGFGLGIDLDWDERPRLDAHNDGWIKVVGLNINVGPVSYCVSVEVG